MRGLIAEIFGHWRERTEVSVNVEGLREKRTVRYRVRLGACRIDEKCLRDLSREVESIAGEQAKEVVMRKLRERGLSVGDLPTDDVISIYEEYRSLFSPRYAFRAVHGKGLVKEIKARDVDDLMKFLRDTFVEDLEEINIVLNSGYAYLHLWLSGKLSTSSYCIAEGEDAEVVVGWGRRVRDVISKYRVGYSRLGSSWAFIGMPMLVSAIYVLGTMLTLAGVVRGEWLTIAAMGLGISASMSIYFLLNYIFPVLTFKVGRRRKRIHGSGVLIWGIVVAGLSLLSYGIVRFFPQAPPLK
ncbi:MAG: hypothetical protein ACUVXI_07200 [bacterium]